MLKSFFRLYFSAFSAFYVFTKLLHLPYKRRTSILSALFSIIVSSVGVFVFYCVDYLIQFAYIIMVLIISIFNCRIHKTSKGVAATYSTIAYALSNALLSISSFSMFPIVAAAYSLFGVNESVDFVLYLINDVLGVLLAVLLFRIRRFKNGMTFLEERISNEMGVFISVICILILTLSAVESSGGMVMFAFAVFIMVCGVLIIFAWNRRIRETYTNKVHARNINSLEQDIEELKKENDAIRRDNEELSKIIHRDNKLIPAMNMSVRSLMSELKDEEISGESREKAEKIMRDLNEMSDERHGIVTTYEDSYTTLRPTGFIRIDAILIYMNHKANEVSTRFDYKISYDISNIIGSIIDEERFNTLLADLVENALISVTYQETSPRIVHVDFKDEDGHFRLDIYDSGIPFKPRTILNLGRKRSTTHADAGGSGIGLMTTLEIIRKIQASFVIDEEPDADGCEKCISVIFDGLSEIRIKSSRPEIIKVCRQRGDVVMMS